MYVSLDETFEDLKVKALPFATRMVRDETGMSTRDDDVDEVLVMT